MRLYLLSGRRHIWKYTVEKSKKNATMWICILLPKFFEDTYEETQTILEWWLFVILGCPSKDSYESMTILDV